MKSKLIAALDELNDAQVEFVYHLCKKLFGVDEKIKKGAVEGGRKETRNMA